MFVGKNIHLSPIDGKPLCSFSRKICRQRRLHGYAFCIHHILEDTEAPFKQCQYTTKSGETCINPVPIAADRLYCNNHMHLMGLLPKPIKKIVEQKALNSKTPPAKAKKKTQDSNQVKSTQSKRRKHLEKKKPIIENTWSSTFAKATENANTKLRQWQQCKKSKCIENLLDMNNANKDDMENLTCYRVNVPPSSGDECIVESFQSSILSTYERVRHNVLEIDDIKTQEAKLICKLKHQYAQLRHVIRHKQESGKFSYSVLSKLIECARNDPLNTANVLNTTENIHDTPVRKIFRSRDTQTRYVVPCCLMTENERCVKPTLPYTRYCVDHIGEDSDQMLFLPHKDKKTSATGGVLRFLHDKTANNEVNRRYGSSESASELKRNNKRNVFKKPSHRKKSKIKRTTNVKKVANRSKFRMKCMKQYDLQDFRKDTKKLHAHLNTNDEKLVDIDEKDTEEDLSGVDCKAPVLSSDGFNTAPTLSDSSSDSESDPDILTPEEAFHLPPGSLSFPPGMDDDDALSGMRNSRGCHGMADDEEEVLMRCDSNFILDPDKQSMINQELCSPTGMDDLSEFDQSIGMFLANTDTPELSPSSLMTLPTTSVVPSSIPNFFTSSVHNNNGSLQRNYTNSTCGDQSKITSSVTNNSFNTASQQSLSLPPKKYNINGALRKTSNLGPSTLLKISPVNMSSRQGSIPIRSYTSKPLNGHILSGNQQHKTSNFTNSKKPPIINESYSSSLSNQSKASLCGLGQSKAVLQQNGGCWNNGDALVYNSSVYCEPDMLSEIAMDEDTPLEKVNPDIFFTSAFPVATCQADL